MPTENANSKAPPSRRRFVLLAAAIVVAIATYTAGWFYIGGELVAQMQASLDEMIARGRRANCDGMEARGYPFRIGLFCSGVMYESAPEGIAISAGAFRSAAQIYSPFRAVGELDGPARLELPGFLAMTAKWDRMRISAHLADPVPERASLEFAGLDLTTSFEPAQKVAGVSGGEAHMRTRGRAADYAFALNGVAIEPAMLDGRSLPLLAFEVDISLEEGVRSMTTPGRSLRNQAGMIRRLHANAETGGGLTVTGPFTIDAQGLIDADLELTLEDPSKLADVLAKIFPENGAAIVSGIAGFAGSAKPGQNPKLPLRIRKSSPVLGFFTLDPLPPIK